MSHNNLFETVTSNTNNDIPIVLVDTSSSTKSKMNTGKSILNTFADVILKHINRNYRMLFWDYSYHIIDGLINITNTISIIQNANRAGSATDISVAFKHIPNEWLTECDNIYILTDGDINADKYKFADQIRELTKSHQNIKLHIISVEDNKRDYKNVKYSAGNKIYQMIKENRLTRHVKNFLSYNNFYCIDNDNHFTNLHNPDINEGYIPYEEKCFPITKTNQFIQYIDDLVAIYAGDSDEINRMLYNLSFTIYHLTKNKPIKIQNDIIDMFCDIFTFIGIGYSEVKELLVRELINHQTNMTNTLQDYIAKRNKLFERANQSLMDDCINNISYCKQMGFMTLPIETDMGLVIFEDNKTTGPVKMRTTEYKNAGIQIDEHTLPAYPTKVVHSLFTNQCMRQWLRAVLSSLYSKKTNSDIILYKFLAIALKVYLSAIPDYIKKAYIDMSLIMLDRKRYQCGIKEIDHLLAGNPPLPVFDNFDKMNDILGECADEFGVHKYSFWYAVIVMLNDDTLLENQKIYCKEALAIDNMTFENVIEELKDKLKINIAHVKLNTIDLEYYCYISLDNTTDTGGFKVPTHTVGKHVCNPKYVITEDSYNDLKKQNKPLSCPICHINIDMFEWVGPKVNEPASIEYKIIANMFNNQYHETITMDNLKYGDALLNMNDLDFSTTSYAIDIPHITGEMNPFMMIYKTTTQFMNQLGTSPYAFILDMDLSNVCVGGGLCRSIILDQSINDMDLFFYGLGNDEIINKIKQMVPHIVNVLKGEFMIINKQNTNVLELLRYVMRDNKKEVTHKIQFILVQNQDIKSMFSNFDLNSCKVAFDGANVWFNKSSYDAYKYMINIVNEEMYTTTYDLRLKKYYDNGFAIVAPGLQLNEYTKMLQLGSCKIHGHIDNVNNNKFIANTFNIGNSKQGSGKELYSGISSKKVSEPLYNGTKSDDSNEKEYNLMDETLEYIKNVNKEGIIISHKIINCNTNLDDSFYDNLYNGNMKAIPKIEKHYSVDWYGKHAKNYSVKKLQFLSDESDESEDQ